MGPSERASCFLLMNTGVTWAVLKVLLKQGVKDRTLFHCMTPRMYLFFHLEILEPGNRLLVFFFRAAVIEWTELGAEMM